MAYADIGVVKRLQRSAVALLCAALFSPLAWANVDQGLLEKAEALGYGDADNSAVIQAILKP